MDNIAKGLMGLAAVAFVIAVVAALFTDGAVASIPAESFSRACSNLALISIAMMLMGKGSASS